MTQGRAVMAGVMYDQEKNTGNPNSATNHYVTIVGMGTDDKGAYFSYYDNFSGGAGKDVGTDVSKNKFRLVKGKDGTYYFADIDNNLPYNKNMEVKLDSESRRPARYVLTEVRDNK